MGQSAHEFVISQVPLAKVPFVRGAALSNQKHALIGSILALECILFVFMTESKNSDFVRATVRVVG